MTVVSPDERDELVLKRWYPDWTIPEDDPERLK
jgi:hypothetical protein